MFNKFSIKNGQVIEGGDSESSKSIENKDTSFYALDKNTRPIPPYTYIIVFTDKRDPIGGHAVAIIGWGEDIISMGKDISGNNTMKNVKYWLCRNSWGTEWATNGYFKMAMYPNNLISQFDKVTETIDILISGGGVMLMTVSREPELIIAEVTDYDINKGLLMDRKYYMDNENINKKVKKQEIKKQEIKKQNIKLKNKEFYNVLNEITFSNLFYLLLFLILVYVVIYF